MDYDPTTGIFTWRVRRSTMTLAGHKAGYVREDSGRKRIFISIKKKKYSAHKLAFLYMIGNIPKEIDHEDRDSTNNKWSNLREATHQQNCFNRKKRSNNTSGYKGVFFDKKKKR